jgi:2-polyprenyl-6-methoxyphenol hydroxylase-like FAD-dependent oxidoreductase
METQVCIVGGGPAGMMLGWLLARAGVGAVVLEKHHDFFRDFRGDTIHPSTLDLMEELGAIDDLLAIRHSEISHIDFRLLGERVPGPDLSQVPARHKFVAMIPQWEFLDFVRRRAERLPGFRLEMGAEVVDLLRYADTIAGVKLADGRELRAPLVVGCDGRNSVVRARAGLPVRDLGAPIDVLWFRIPRLPGDDEQVFAIVTASSFFVMLDRHDYWQCAYLIAKGGLEAMKARGLGAFQAELRALAPFLGDRVEAVRQWDDVKLLTVRVDRLLEWARPGLLCIGDAAHSMSPVGGVGINLAIQDAVAAANLLAPPLLEELLTFDDLRAVQTRREPAAIRTQTLQLQIHARVLAKVVAGRGERSLRVSRWVLRHAPAVRRYMARAIGVGYTPEHVAS